jgi:hypothetical protein
MALRLSRETLHSVVYTCLHRRDETQPRGKTMTTSRKMHSLDKDDDVLSKTTAGLTINAISTVSMAELTNDWDGNVDAKTGTRVCDVCIA